jgi:hypothetical protein
MKDVSHRRNPPSYLSEPLRVDFIFEVTESMQSYLVSFAEALWRGNIEAASGYWEAARACGKQITGSLTEIEKARADD